MFRFVQLQYLLLWFGLCSYSIYCCGLVCAVTVFIVVVWFVQLRYLLLCLGLCSYSIIVVFYSIWCYVRVVCHSFPYRSLSNMHCSSYCALDKGQHAVGVLVPPPLFA